MANYSELWASGIWFGYSQVSYWHSHCHIFNFNQNVLRNMCFLSCLHVICWRRGRSLNRGFSSQLRYLGSAHRLQELCLARASSLGLLSCPVCEACRYCMPAFLLSLSLDARMLPLPMGAFLMFQTPPSLFCRLGVSPYQVSSLFHIKGTQLLL